MLSGFCLSGDMRAWSTHQHSNAWLDDPDGLLMSCKWGELLEKCEILGNAKETCEYLFGKLLWMPGVYAGFTTYVRGKNTYVAHDANYAGGDTDKLAETMKNNGM